MTDTEKLSPDLEERIDALELASAIDVHDLPAARSSLREAIREMQRKADAFDWMEQTERVFFERSRRGVQLIRVLDPDTTESLTIQGNALEAIDAARSQVGG